jgi:hypothetical protein
MAKLPDVLILSTNFTRARLALLFNAGYIISTHDEYEIWNMKRKKASPLWAGNKRLTTLVNPLP